MPTLKMERAKMVLVARTVSNTSGLDEKAVLNTMCAIRELDVNALPNIVQACNATGVSLGFINDMGKIQFLYERNPVMEEFTRFLVQVSQ